MGSRGLLLLAPATSSNRLLLSRFSKLGFWEALGQKEKKIGRGVHNCRVQSSLEPPNVPRLAETARISLTPDEAEEFAPKIQQVVDWFGQLQSVDLHSVEPAIRADTEVGNFREDSPEVFENREAMIAAVPNFEESFIKVPKVLNKD